MATKLKHLKIKKVDFVDDGANPEAFIRLYKSKEGAAPTPEENIVENPKFWNRFMAAVAKAFKLEDEQAEDGPETEDVAKGGAESFGDKFSEVKNRKICDEVWDICYALQSSICSILNDEELDSTQAGDAMRESLNEFTEVVSAAIGQWSGGKAASIAKKETEVTASELELMKSNRDRLEDIIAKVSILWYPAANSDADSEFYRLFWNAAVYQFVETLQYRNDAGPADPGDPVDDRDLFWLLSGLDCKLSDCRKQRERICLAVLCSRCSGAACLYGILSAAADNERKAVDPGTGILESYACLALPDGCGGQFVPIDSLPEQLVLLYRSPWQTGDSALVSAVLFLGGTCRVCLYTDDKAACDCRCDWRSASGRSDVADRGTHASWGLVWHDIGTKEVETPCRVRKK